MIFSHDVGTPSTQTPRVRDVDGLQGGTQYDLALSGIVAQVSPPGQSLFCAHDVAQAGLGRPQVPHTRPVAHWLSAPHDCPVVRSGGTVAFDDAEQPSDAVKRIAM